MQMINTNLSSLMLQLTQASSKGISSFGHNFCGNKTGVGKDIACVCAPEVTENFSPFDKTVSNFAAFNDMIATAQTGLSQMKSHGEGIRAIIERAREEGLSDELLASLEEEVNERLAAIQQIKENTTFNNINPFERVFSLDVPEWQDYIASPKTEEGEENDDNSMSEVLASISFDMSVNGDDENSAFSIGASATIEIGINKDGALQINVDATMDFDLSGLTQDGLGSDSALDMINRFIELITGKQNDLNTASNIMTGLFASATANIEGNGFAISASNDINMESMSSKELKGQIVQHASITLDSTANQIPSIAINLL